MESTKKGLATQIEWPKEWDRNEGWPGQHAVVRPIEQLRRFRPELLDQVVAEMRNEAVEDAHQHDPTAWDRVLGEDAI